MITIRTFEDLKKYLKIVKGESLEYQFNFYTNGKLDVVLFTKDFSLDTLSLHENEKSLEKIVNCEIKIKAGGIRGYNLSCDYISAKTIDCNNLELTYSLECETIRANNIESLNLKAKNIKVKKISCSYIECQTLLCETANFYSLTAEQVIANSLSGVVINCDNVNCQNIKLD